MTATIDSGAIHASDARSSETSRTSGGSMPTVPGRAKADAWTDAIAGASPSHSLRNITAIV